MKSRLRKSASEPIGCWESYRVRQYVARFAEHSRTILVFGDFSHIEWSLELIRSTRTGGFFEFWSINKSFFITKYYELDGSY